MTRPVSSRWNVYDINNTKLVSLNLQLLMWLWKSVNSKHAVSNKSVWHLQCFVSSDKQSLVYSDTDEGEAEDVHVVRHLVCNKYLYPSVAFVMVHFHLDWSSCKMFSGIYSVREIFAGFKSIVNQHNGQRSMFICILWAHKGHHWHGKERSLLYLYYSELNTSLNPFYSQISC